MIPAINEYNGLVHTFLSEPLLKEDWNDLSSDHAGTTPVTLGTDNLFPTAIPSQCLRKPCFNRIGTGSTADMNTYFYKHGGAR